MALLSPFILSLGHLQPLYPRGASCGAPGAPNGEARHFCSYCLRSVTVFAPRALALAPLFVFTELMAIVSAKIRPEVNPLPSRNASTPPGNPLSSTQVGAAHSQTNLNEPMGSRIRAEVKQIRLQRLTLV